jgi:dihydrolipoamide dehydrogenase
VLEPRTCDVAVIGAGTAGLAAYRASRDAGARTVLIEAGPGGTTCARSGCMPSKLLLAAGRKARSAAPGRPFGIALRTLDIDGRAVMARVRRERDRFVADVLKEIAALPEADRVRGRARFAGADRLTIDDHTLIQARSIVIATGARPVVPDGLATTCADRLVTHESVFDLETLPRALAVIGAGPLGLELALAFARLGVKTTVFDEGPDIGGVRDPKVAEAVRRTLARELTFEFGAETRARQKADGDILLSWSDASGAGRRSTFSHVLVAAGRRPAVDALDLNLAGLALDERGVPEFDPRTLRCGRSGIFIAGDANDDRPVLHEASLQGELAGRNAARAPDLERRAAMPEFALVYTAPDIARIGAGFDPGAAKDWTIGCSDSVGRAIIEEEDPGCLRVYAGSDGALIGGELFGPDVEHLAHLLAWAVQLKLSARAVLELPFYHPTVEEGFRTALRDIARRQGDD